MAMRSIPVLGLGILAPAGACGGGAGGAPLSVVPDASVDGADPGARADGGTGAQSSVKGATYTMVSSLPVVPNAGGPILASPKLVTVTFPNFAYESQVEAFGAIVVGSSWIAAVGADYGVGPGTHMHVTLTSDTPPATAADADIQALLRSRLHDGTLPGGVRGSERGYVYMVFYPPSTQLGTSTCVSDLTGSYRNQDWHLAEDDRNGRFAYVAMGTCVHQSIVHLGLQASHELIEAATDPYPETAPAWHLPSSSPWQAFGGEIGDLCEMGAQNTVREDGISLQRIWSNSAASAGKVPCVPEPSNQPYVVVLGAPDVVHSIKPGGSVDVRVVGWSSEPIPTWGVSVRQGSSTTVTVQPRAFSTTADAKTALTLSVPSSTPSGTRAAIVLLSSSPDDADRVGAVSGWPVVLDVQ
jgi:hypothetical protein